MNLDGIWTWFLDIVGQLLVPAWNDLIQYIPLLLIGLLVLAFAGLAWWWRRHSAVNRTRVPAPLPRGRKPADLHMPGPSLWPFVAPIGLLLMTFSLALGVTTSLGSLALFGLGVAVGVVGVLGWYLEAGREYQQVEAGPHGQHALLAGGAAAGPPAWTLEPPDGVHLPGPSAWPFLAPIGLGFAVAGLIFGPVLIISGLAMGAIASIGWLTDANREPRQWRRTAMPCPRRGPERAFPKALGPVYAAVAGAALVFTLLPWALSLLPAGGGGEEVAGPPPTLEPYVSASLVTEFEVTEIAVPADEPFRLTFENRQVAVPHNVAIYDTPDRAIEYFVGKIFDGPATRVYEVGPLSAGTYFYVCSVHPPMTGTLYAR